MTPPLSGTKWSATGDVNTTSSAYQTRTASTSCRFQAAIHASANGASSGRGIAGTLFLSHRAAAVFRPSTGMHPGVMACMPCHGNGYSVTVDTRAFVDELNKDLEFEFQSIVQYVQHIAVMKGAEFASTIDELRVHVTQEISHASTLAEQVDFLGGVPTVTVPPIPSHTDTRAALEADLELEVRQLERYRERVQQ